MDAKKWGPHLWFYMHTISFNYPDNPNFNDKSNYLNFYNSLKTTIPCEKCKNHYSSHLLQNPPRLETRDSLVKWTIDLHNQVNETLGKRKWDYQEALDLYKRYYKNLDESNDLRNIEFSTNITENNKLVVKGIQITVLILLISFCFYYLLKNRKKNFKKIIRL